MSRPLRLAGYIAIGVVTGLLIAVVAIWILSRTEWGMERVRAYAVRWIAERVDGTVIVGRLSGPGLLGGVVIHDFSIVGENGRLFMTTDSLELNYNISTLLRGQVVLDDVVLYHPEVVIEQLPGDTAWNFEYVFPDRTPGEEDTRRLIMFEDAIIVDGTVTVRYPFESGDASRIIVEQLPLGLARVLRFEDINARLDRAVWESNIETGRMFDIRSLETRAFVYKDPINIQNARGDVTIRDSIIAVDLLDVELPGTSASVLGTVIMQDERNALDFRIDAPRVSFADLTWLAPELPDEGGGSIVLRIQSQPTGTLWLAEEVNLSTPGTNVAGSFGVVTGDTLYFTQVDLRASPLDVDLLESVLPGGLPVEGLLVGTVEVRGPLSALETSGDMRLAAKDGSPASAVAWTGVFDVRNGGMVTRSLEADVRHLELSLVSAFAPAVRLSGSVSGRVAGTGGRGGMSFTALLEHASANGTRSVFDGGGTVEGGGRSRRYDLTISASPVTLQDIAQQVPALDGLQGQLTGPVRVEGTADDLGFSAEFATPGGPLQVEGRVQGSGLSRRIAATAEAHGFRPDAFRSGLPPTFMSGRLTVNLVGDEFATMSGPVELVLDSTRFGDLPHSRVFVYGRMGDGVLVVDSARLRGPIGVGRANGTIGLVEGRTGRLEVGFTTESLTALEPFIYASGPAVDGEPRVTGRVEATGTVTGRVGDLAIEASATGQDILIGDVSAVRMHAEAVATGVGTSESGYRLVATADSARSFSHPLQVARLELTAAGDSIAVTAGATANGESRVFARGAMHRSDDTRGVQVTTVHLDELRLGGQSPWLLGGPSQVEIRDGIAVLDSLVLERGSGGRAVAQGRLAWLESGTRTAPRIDFDIDITDVPFTDVLGAMRSTATGGGTIDGILRLSGTALNPFIEAEVNARDIVYGDVSIDRAYAELNYAGLGLDAHAEAQYGGRSIIAGGGRIPIDLRLTPVTERRLDEDLRVTITADSLPVALPLGLIDGFTNAGGRIDGTMVVGGTTFDPSLSGGFAIHDGTVDWDVSGVRYRDVTGNFILESGRLLRVDVSALSADPRGRNGPFGASPVGNGTVKGTLDLTVLSDPMFDLTLRANGVYAARRRDVEARVTGDVRLGGRYTRPELSGQLRVDDGALYIEELYRQYLIAGVALEDLSQLSLVDTSLVAVRPIIAASQNPFLKNLRVDGMEVDIGADSWVRSRDMDVEVTGRLNVAFDRRQRDEDLRLTGSLNVERGTYTLYYPPLQSRRFQVRQGTINFPGTPGIDPNLAITAAYKARARGEPLDVLAIVSGTLRNPRVRLSSDVQPPISESDLASYLFFGVPTWEVGSSNSTGSGQNREGGLSSALTPSVLGYASSGLQTLVQNAGLLDYVGLTTVEADDIDDDANGLSNILAETQLEIGSYLTSDLYLGVSKRLGTSNLDAGARIEWRFLPEYSFELFAEDRRARSANFGLRQELGLRKVYGLLLFREWGF